MESKDLGRLAAPFFLMRAGKAPFFLMRAGEAPFF